MHLEGHAGGLPSNADARLKKLPFGQGKQASDEVISAIRQFVTNVGGLANAKKALESLAEIYKAA